MEREVIKYDRSININEYNATNISSNKYFESLGRMIFCYTNTGLKYQVINADDVPEYIKEKGQEEINEYIKFNKEMYYQEWIAHIMDGLEFLSDVDNGCFIDYDGTLSEIYVDGYLTNLGLCHKGICQGKFLVDGEVFRDICTNHHVLVDWANK